MRFIDWNGTGSIDAQDVATSVAMNDIKGSLADDDAQDQEANGPIEASSQAGCLTVTMLCLAAMTAIGITAILL